MIIDCISDLHGFYPKLDGGDLLIVAGDLTARDDEKGLDEFCEWIMSYFGKYKKAIFISGNHDNNAQIKNHKLYQGEQEYKWLIYLEDSGTTFEGLKIWGSPWTKTFPGINPHCKAFTCDTEEELAEKFSIIPEDTDILITHGPPYKVLDQVKNYNTERWVSVGSKSLFEVLKRVKPRLNLFGHIHENGYKQAVLTYPLEIDQLSEEIIKVGRYETICVNCSHVNEQYKPVNSPVRIKL